jgi:hypothetical protein
MVVLYRKPELFFWYCTVYGNVDRMREGRPCGGCVGGNIRAMHTVGHGLLLVLCLIVWIQVYSNWM